MVAVKMPPWGSRSVFTTMTSRSDSTHFHNRDEIFFYLSPTIKICLRKKVCVWGWHVQRAAVKARGRLRISFFSRSEGAACYPRPKCVLAVNDSRSSKRREPVLLFWHQRSFKW